MTGGVVSDGRGFGGEEMVVIMAINGRECYPPLFSKGCMS